MLETLIKEAGHEYIFLPKFHFELNLVIQMVRPNFIYYLYVLSIVLRAASGLNINIVRLKIRHPKMRSSQQSPPFTPPASV